MSLGEDKRLGSTYLRERVSHDMVIKEGDRPCSRSDSIQVERWWMTIGQATQKATPPVHLKGGRYVSTRQVPPYSASISSKTLQSKHITTRHRLQ